MEIIRLEKVKKIYKIGTVEVTALDDISISIHQGEFVSIMGPSGSGKSTLLYLLGILDKPTAGKYFLFDNDISNLQDKQLAVLRNKFFGFVFQNYNLLSKINATENVLLPLIYSDINNHLKQENKQKAVNLLTQLGLAERLYHKPLELSGGQQQRVAIARALVNSPYVLLADEPTGNLDSKSASEIIEIFKKLNSQGITIIMVTHEPELASAAKRIIKLKDGKIVSDELQNSQVHTKMLIHGSITKSINIELPKAQVFNISKLQDYFIEAQKSLFSNKTRTFLSVLGVVVGVASLISMLSLGQGAQEQVKKQISSLGSNLLIVHPAAGRTGGVATESSVIRGMTLEDFKTVKNINEVETVSPIVQGRAQLVYRNKNWNTRVEGVSSEYQFLRNTFPQKGRFFTEEEVNTRSKVLLVGEEVVRQLFGEQDPIGEFIKVNRIDFQIIGILPKRGMTGWRNEDDKIVIPYTTAMFRLFGTNFISDLNIKVKEGFDLDETGEKIKKLLLKLHRLPETKTELIDVHNAAEIQQTITETTKTFSFLLGSIAFVSLLVGGIGIMNIMLVSVTERTKEIGIRKAIGANNIDILCQFMIESIFICILGGILGIMLGCGISILLSSLAKWNTKIVLSSIILAFTFSIAVGLIFGIWPARKASQLTPVDALRYE
ncbi:MAG: ABC transporter permease [Elusimicrobiota bacterium]|nr:ABC transporter permease [Elusimicrobiota bacterium]